MKTSLIITIFLSATLVKIQSFNLTWSMLEDLDTSSPIDIDSSRFVQALHNHSRYKELQEKLNILILQNDYGPEHYEILMEMNQIAAQVYEEMFDEEFDTRPMENFIEQLFGDKFADEPFLKNSFNEKLKADDDSNSLLQQVIENQEEVEKEEEDEEKARLMELAKQYTSSLSSTCGTHLLQYFYNVLYQTRSSNLWASQMFEATAKFPFPWAKNGTFDIGNFDQCIKIHHNEISGRYCVVEKVPKGGSLIRQLRAKFGVCSPSSCTKEDLQIFLNQFETSEYQLKIDSDSCTIDEDNKPLEISTIISIFILVLMITLVTISSIIVTFYPPGSRIRNLCHLLSIQKALNSLIVADELEKALPILRIVKTLAIAHLIRTGILHMAFNVPSNIPDFPEFINKKRNHQILTSTMPETLLFVNGVEAGWLLFTRLRKNNYNHLQFIFFHWLRYAFCMIFAVAILPPILMHLANGPWHFLTTYKVLEACPKHLGGYLFLYGTFGLSSAECMPHLWYLEVEMQLWLLTGLLLFPMVKWPRHSLFFVGFFASFMTTSLYFLSRQENLPPLPFIMFHTDSFSEQIPYFFAKGSPWVIGGYIGILLARQKLQKRSFRVNTILKTVAPIVIVLAGLTIKSWIWRFEFDWEAKYDPVEAALFNALQRLLWSLTLSAGTFVVFHGCAADFLLALTRSEKFQVFSKLVPCIYFLYLPYQAFAYGSLRSKIHLDRFYIWNQSFGDGMALFILAILVYILFWHPAQALTDQFEKSLWRKNDPKEKEKKS